MTLAAPSGAVLGATGEATELYILFRVGESVMALAVSDVIQMESFTGATAVPGAPPWVAGIMQLRGRVVPVVDLRVRFGLPASPPTMDTRVVVGEREGRAVALVVDTAREVVRIAPSQLEPPPRIASDGAQGFVRAIAHLGPRAALVLDFGKVIGEEPLDV